jgi:hypothetical protein
LCGPAVVRVERRTLISMWRGCYRPPLLVDLFPSIRRPPWARATTFAAVALETERRAAVALLVPSELLLILDAIVRLLIQPSSS